MVQVAKKQKGWDHDEKMITASMVFITLLAAGCSVELDTSKSTIDSNPISWNKKRIDCNMNLMTSWHLATNWKTTKPLKQMIKKG
ncbi:hypothetical protein [Neobacillus sp. Marseille-QA0830]